MRSYYFMWTNHLEVVSSHTEKNGIQFCIHQNKPSPSQFMADGYSVSAGQKISLQKNKVYTNYRNRRLHSQCAGVTRMLHSSRAVGGPGNHRAQLTH